MNFAIAPIIDTIGQYAWPFVRIAAWVMAMPILSGAFVPAKVRILTALALTIAIAPHAGAFPATEMTGFAGLMFIAREFLIGVAMGFALQLIFDAIALGGQIISMNMGLGFAVFIDHQNGVNIPVLGQLFMMLGMLLFLAMDGHLAMIQLLADSFHILPMTGMGLGQIAISQILEWAGQLFVVATRLALPAVTALIVVNLAFGVMSRAAPTLNLFAIGFPVSMVLGFAVVFLNLENFRENLVVALDAALAFIPRMLGS